MTLLRLNARCSLSVIQNWRTFLNERQNIFTKSIQSPDAFELPFLYNHTKIRVLPPHKHCARYMLHKTKPVRGALQHRQYAHFQCPWWITAFKIFFFGSSNTQIGLAHCELDVDRVGLTVTLHLRLMANNSPSFTARTITHSSHGYYLAQVSSKSTFICPGTNRGRGKVPKDVHRPILLSINQGGFNLILQ